MSRFPKPPEGSWTEHYGLGTAPVSYEGATSPEYYALEKEAIFKRTWLHVGRIEQVQKVGSYFTKELPVADTSIVVVRDRDGEVRAFHNICRHRGNKLVWTDYPGEETSGTCRQFACKYHGWRYDLDGSLNFVQQEDEFFDLDKSTIGLVPVHCDIWQGFIFVNFAPEPAQSLHEFLGPLLGDLDGYPFELMTERRVYRTTVKANWKLFVDAAQEFYHAPVLHLRQNPPALANPMMEAGFEAPYYDVRQPHRVVSTGGIRAWELPDDKRKPIDVIMRSGLFGAWDKPDLGIEKYPPWDQPGRGVPVGAGLVPGVPELPARDLVPGLGDVVHVLADLPQHPRLRRNAPLRAGHDRARVPCPRPGRRLVQGVPAPGREHTRGDAVDARVGRRRSGSSSATRRCCVGR